MGGVEKFCAARYRSGSGQGGESRCSRWDQEKETEENDDSMRIPSAEELFSLVREEDISVRCSTGCYRLAVLLHYKSYSAPVLQCSLCKTASVPGEIGKGRGRDGGGGKICHAAAGRTDRE